MICPVAGMERGGCQQSWCHVNQGFLTPFPKKGFKKTKQNSLRSKLPVWQQVLAPRTPGDTQLASTPLPYGPGELYHCLFWKLDSPLLAPWLVVRA